MAGTGNRRRAVVVVRGGRGNRWTPEQAGRRWRRWLLEVVRAGGVAGIRGGILRPASAMSCASSACCSWTSGAAQGRPRSSQACTRTSSNSSPRRNDTRPWQGATFIREVSTLLKRRCALALGRPLWLRWLVWRLVLVRLCGCGGWRGASPILRRRVLEEGGDVHER